MTEQSELNETIPADVSTSADALTPTPAEPVTIPGTPATPPVTISAAEHQLISDLKAAGNDLVVLFGAIIAEGEEVI